MITQKTYNDNTKRPKLKGNQLGILGISSREFMHYVGKFSESPWVQESAAGAIFESFCLIYWCV